MTPEIEKQLAIAKEGLERCSDVLGDPTYSNAQTKREFISAILLPCVQLFKRNMQIRIERKLGCGPVDYVITCEGLEIIVTEAKKGEQAVTIYRNVGELHAAQQVILARCRIL